MRKKVLVTLAVLLSMYLLVNIPTIFSIYKGYKEEKQREEKALEILSISNNNELTNEEKSAALKDAYGFSDEKTYSNGVVEFTFGSYPRNAIVEIMEYYNFNSFEAFTTYEYFTSNLTGERSRHNAYGAKGYIETDLELIDIKYWDYRFNPEKLSIRLDLISPDANLYDYPYISKILYGLKIPNIEDKLCWESGDTILNLDENVVDEFSKYWKVRYSCKKSDVTDNYIYTIDFYKVSVRSENIYGEYDCKKEKYSYY